MKEKRHTLTYFEPTKRWLKSIYANPRSKKEIIGRYNFYRKRFMRRLQGPIKTKMECWVIYVDRETRKEIRREREPREFVHDWPRLSQQDYKVMMRLLEEWYATAKKEFNERLRQTKRAAYGKDQNRTKTVRHRSTA